MSAPLVLSGCLLLQRVIGAAFVLLVRLGPLEVAYRVLLVRSAVLVVRCQMTHALCVLQVTFH